MRSSSKVVAGVDIGAATAKAVLMNGEGLLASAILPTGHSVAKSGEMVLRNVLEQVSASLDDLRYIVSTGYGRRAVTFAHRAVTEIICHGAGVYSTMPQAKTIIDIGGQDSKVIALDEKGQVSNFAMNEKCAAGTGRFLEVIAGVLELDINEIGALSLTSKDPCAISSTCTIFAESEVVSLRAEGRSREDLIAGIHKAMANRVAIMGKSVEYRKDVVFTGGVAKNIGIRKALEDEIGMEILTPEEPQIMGALGAAILAKAELVKQGGQSRKG